MKRDFLFKNVILVTLLVFTACGGGSSSTSETASAPENENNVMENDNSSEENNASDTENTDNETLDEEGNTNDVNSESNSTVNESVDTNPDSEDSMNSGEATEDDPSEESNDTNTSEISDGENTATPSDETNATDQNSTESTNTPEESEESSDVNLTQEIQNAKSEPYFKYAWHIDAKDNILNEEGYTIDANADINLTAAWELSMGEGVKVAVIDDGAEVDHEDLKENVFLAYNADNNGTDVNPNLEKGSHGNTCAGFIVAPINTTGMVGVSPKAQLIAIRQEEGSDEKTIRAFEYAKNSGAKVISCSWGTENVSEAVISQLKELYDAGVTVVFASGNDGKDLDSGVEDESEVEWVIGVGASGENNDVTSYSNYGKNIDIIAPGGDTVLSSGLLGLDDMGEQGSSSQLDKVNNNYAFADGTSFATPVVAGVIVLMYAVHPDITPKEVREILIQTADKVGTEVDADYSTNSFDRKRAYGKVNAGKAVLEAKKLAE